MTKINQDDLRYIEVEKNFIWNGNDLTVLLKEGSLFLQNCWPHSVTFGELDYSSSETVTIETSVRYSSQ